MRSRLDRATIPFALLAVAGCIAFVARAEEPPTKPAASPTDTAKAPLTDAEKAKLIEKYQREIDAIVGNSEFVNSDDMAKLDKLFGKIEDLQRLDITPEKFAAWRKQYGFQSLAGRLEYERRAKFETQPRLSVEAEKHLKQEEDPDSRFTFASGIRAYSLEMLHTMEREEFIKRSGFGVSRMPNPGAESIEIEDDGPIPFATVAPPSAEEMNQPPQPLPTAQATKADEPARSVLSWLPTREDAANLHDSNRRFFANYWSYGWVQSVDRVAGFDPHKIGYAPPMPIDMAPQPLVERDGRKVPHEHPTAQSKRWKLARLELVSLLKHETPRVYLSDHLPRMEDLSSTKTRALDDFETPSLTKLLDGEELITAATPNRIVMLGAVRASNDCRQCHQVPRGTLLGAFSYELRRDPPLALKPQAGSVQ